MRSRQQQLGASDALSTVDRIWSWPPRGRPLFSIWCIVAHLLYSFVRVAVQAPASLRRTLLTTRGRGTLFHTHTLYYRLVNNGQGATGRSSATSRPVAWLQSRGLDADVPGRPEVEALQRQPELRADVEVLVRRHRHVEQAHRAERRAW
jgi:hypothetical protein